jgi:hypothetical protein
MAENVARAIPHQPAFALGWKPFLYGFSQKRFPNGEQFDI